MNSITVTVDGIYTITRQQPSSNTLEGSLRLTS